MPRSAQEERSTGLSRKSRTKFELFIDLNGESALGDDPAPAPIAGRLEETKLGRVFFINKRLGAL
jgi:hypothetical protein